MKKGLIAIVGLLLILLVTACGDSTSNKKELQEGEGTVQENNDENSAEQDIKKLVQDYSVGNFEDVSASITSHELIVTDSNDNKTTYSLPEDEFFVSIAPFIETTHPCAIHSLTSCQGELVEEEFDILIQDEEGNVIVDETVVSLANGFIDLWLPREKTYNVVIEYDGKAAEAEISTFEGDNTCITTMQLL